MTGADETAEVLHEHPRVPGIAGILAFFCIGLGHLYVGKGGVGLALVLGLFAVRLGIAALAVWTDTAIALTFWSAILLGVVVWAAQLIWAVRAARRADPSYRLRWYNSKPIYAAFALVTFLASERAVTRAVIVETFKMTSGSMQPTLEIGDQFVVAKLGERNRTPRRGDIVAFRRPTPPYESYVKRVAAVSGDTVEIRHGVVFINGTPLPRRDEGPGTYWDRDSETGTWHPFEARAFAETVDDTTYTVLQDARSPPSVGDFGPHVVAEGHVFVIGDNRDHSFDSRAWPPGEKDVPIENVIGRAHAIWFSWGRSGFNLDRIGMRL